MEALPDSELARRAAGGDGATFVRLYDRYSAEIFETALRATGSVDTASAATQTAFLKLLTRPPALGAPDAEVAERLRALAIGAGVEGAILTRPVGGGTESGWLRSETVGKAGERFDEDWSPHLERARPASVAAPALAPQAATAEPRRSLIAAIEDLPLRAAGVVVLFLAALTFGAALLRMDSQEPQGATDAAEAADDRPAERKQSADERKKIRPRRAGSQSGPSSEASARSGDEAGAPTSPGRNSPVGTQRVAGRRRANAAPRRPPAVDDGGTVRDRQARGDAPAPEPQPEPAPVPVPAPEPAPAPAPAPEDTVPGRNGQGNANGHDKPRGYERDGDG